MLGRVRLTLGDAWRMLGLVVVVVRLTLLLWQALSEHDAFLDRRLDDMTRSLGDGEFEP